MKKGLLAIGALFAICLSMLATDMVVKQNNGKDRKINVVDTSETFLRFKILSDSTVELTKESSYRGYDPFTTLEYCGHNSITIPEKVRIGRKVYTVTSIGIAAFYRCDNLISISIPEGVTSIGVAAFEGCRSLTNIDIPESLTNIGENAFSGCYSLENISIPEGVTNIGEFAFSGCSSLKSINIPESVTSIGASTFYGCSSLEPKLLVYDKGTKCYGWVGNKEKCTNVVIPDEVTSIGEKAFQKCVNLNTIYNCSSINIKKNSSNYGYVGYYADNIYEHKMHSSEVPPSCEENGYTLHKCVLCEYSYTNNLVSSTGHKDDNGDYICDYGCGHEFEKPIEPEQPDAPDEPSDDDCGHLCHKSGFMGFIWKIVRFFWKLFKMNPICECGVAHY